MRRTNRARAYVFLRRRHNNTGLDLVRGALALVTTKTNANARPVVSSIL